MLATQLDNFLGGDPVQHRQVQGYESPEFMNLFPRGVSYKVRCGCVFSHSLTCTQKGLIYKLTNRYSKTVSIFISVKECLCSLHSHTILFVQEGGVESGFRKTQSGSGPVHRLYQIKGKRNIRAKEVDLSWQSFNKGDCFILDLGEVSACLFHCCLCMSLYVYVCSK